MPATNYGSLAINGDTPGIFPNGPTGAPTMGDQVGGRRLVTFQATAAANTDQSVPLPLGARIVGVTFLENVVPTGVTPAFTIGSTQGGADVVASTSITVSTTVGLIAVNGARPLLVANFASIVASSAGGSIVWIRYAQGTPTAVGTFTIVIEYVMT